MPCCRLAGQAAGIVRRTRSPFRRGSLKRPCGLRAAGTVRARNTPSPTLTKADEGILRSNTLQVMRAVRTRESALGTIKCAGFACCASPMRSSRSKSPALGLATSGESERKLRGSPRRASSARVWECERLARQNSIDEVCPRTISMRPAYYGKPGNGRAKMMFDQALYVRFT